MSLSLLCLNHYNPFGEKIKYANLLYNLFIFSPNGFSSCECHTPATARYCSGGVIGKPSWELANRKASKCVEKQKQTDKKKTPKKKKKNITEKKQVLLIATQWISEIAVVCQPLGHSRPGDLPVVSGLPKPLCAPRASNNPPWFPDWLLRMSSTKTQRNHILYTLIWNKMI